MAEEIRAQLASEHAAREVAAERSRRLRALHDAALALSTPTEPDREAVAALLGRITDRAREAVGGVDAGLVLTEDAAWADLLPGSDADAGAIWLDYRGRLGRRRLRPSGATAFVLATGEPVTVADTAAESPFGRYDALSQRGIRAFAIVPLSASGRVLGSLSVNFAQPRATRAPAGAGDPSGGRVPGAVRPSAWEASAPDLLPLFAAHAAAALDRVRLAFSERRVARQAEQLVRQDAEAAALRELDRLKDELLVTIAHELRTPLTVLYGYALRLRARADRLAPSEVEQTAERMLAAAVQLKRLVEELLDFGNLQRGQVVIQAEDVDLAAVLQGLVDAFRTHPGGDQIVGAWPAPLPVHADPARLTQAIGNVLENALRYAPEGQIALRAAPVAPDRRMVRIEVQDHGPGIPVDEQARVWDRFFRGARVAGMNVARGSGIGLAVVKALVEAHGGRVGLESAPGQGARFWMELPVGLDLVGEQVSSQDQVASQRQVDDEARGAGTRES